MAVTAKLYHKAFTALANKEIDWGSDTIKVALCSASYTPDQAAHDYYNDITNELTTANGYTAGGATLGSKTETITAGVKAFDAADVTWTSTTITARYAVIYDDTPATAATKPLIGYVDFGEDLSSSAGDFKITWAAGGIFTITVA